VDENSNVFSKKERERVRFVGDAKIAKNYPGNSESAESAEPLRFRPIRVRLNVRRIVSKPNRDETTEPGLTRIELPCMNST
jgi:hypothetical protein